LPFFVDDPQLGQHCLTKPEKVGIPARAVAHGRQVGVNDSDPLESKEVEASEVEPRLTSIETARLRAAIAGECARSLARKGLENQGATDLVLAGL